MDEQRAIGCAAGDVNPRARFLNDHVTIKDIIASNCQTRSA
ncbi:hypothetical protein [uncultured Adlercreutzia sp.]|nr:hypothetical protein [uncultured Adlercreutzia sp.]